MPKRVRVYTDAQRAQANARAKKAYGSLTFEQRLKRNKKHAARVREKRKSDPDRTRDAQYRRYYGISLAQYDALLVSQGGRCAICRTDDAKAGGGRGGHFHVDHDHTKPKGEVRGLLCFECNILLGKAKDQPLILRAATRYLEEH